MWPEDTVTNTLSLDIPSGQWYVNWVVTPGATGNAGGQVPFGGGVTFDPTTDCKCSCLSMRGGASRLMNWQIDVTHGAPYAHVSSNFPCRRSDRN